MAGVPCVFSNKFRKLSSPLKEPIFYHLDDPGALVGYHAWRVTLTQAEVDDLVTRAQEKARWGTEFIPPDLCPESLRSWHGNRFL